MFFFSSRRRHTRYWRDWSSDVCSSDLESTRPTIVVSSVMLESLNRSPFFAGALKSASKIFLALSWLRLGPRNIIGLFIFKVPPCSPTHDRLCNFKSLKTRHYGPHNRYFDAIIG